MVAASVGLGTHRNRVVPALFMCYFLSVVVGMGDEIGPVVVPPEIALEADAGPALKSFLNSLPEHSQVSFGTGRIYTIGTNVTVTKSLKIFGGGSRLLQTAGAVLGGGAVLRFDSGKTTYKSLSFAVTAGEDSFEIPAGATLGVGDMVLLLSADVRIYDYLKGHLATVTSTDGGTARLSTPFCESFICTSIEKRSALVDCEVSDLFIDQTAYPNTFSYSPGLHVYGDRVLYRNVKVVGNDYSMQALVAQGEHFLAEHCVVETCLNVQGLSGGGRVGYGIVAAGNYAVIRNNILTDCKHGVAGGASRSIVLRGLTVEDNQIFESPDRAQADFTGSLDCHANFYGIPVFRRNLIHSRAESFTVRSGKSCIANNRIFQVGAPAAQRVLFLSEMPITDLAFSENEITLHPGGMVLGTIGVPLDNVEVSDNTVHNGSLMYPSSLAYNISGLRIKRNKIRNGNFLAYLNVPATAVNTDIEIDDNDFESSANTSADCVRFRTSTLGARTAKFMRLSVQRNRLHRQSTTLGCQIKVESATYEGLKINGNAVSDAPGAPAYGVLLMDVHATDLELLNNILVWADEAVGGPSCGRIQLLTANAQSAVLRRIRIAFNSCNRLDWSEGAAAPIIFDEAVFEDNEVWRTTSDRPVIISCRTGSTGWAASTPVFWRRNRVTNKSSIGTLQINGNCVGNKLVFEYNNFYGPIEELSRTYYQTPIGHLQTTANGNLPWKGGTVVKYDGLMYAAAPPATDTWAAGEKVFHLTPAESGISGWICVTAGTPGLWQALRANAVPVAHPQSVVLAEDTVVAITLAATDADVGDTLTSAILTQPAHGMLSGMAPNVTYTPKMNYNGGDSFTFKVNDGQADSNTATVSITVTAVNDAPVIASGPTAMPNPALVGETISFVVAATDLDSDGLSFAWTFGDGQSGSGATPTHTYAAAGTYTAAVTATDGQGGGGSASVTIVVNAPVTYIIAATADTGGTSTPSGHVTVVSGAAQSFTFAPDPGFALADLRVDGTSVGAVASYTFNNVTANHTIAASFSPIIQPFVCVSRIDLTVRKNVLRHYAAGDVYMTDHRGAAIGGATVTIAWSGVVNGTATAVSGADGRAMFESEKNRSKGPYTLTVTGIAAGDLPYDSTKNTVTAVSARYDDATVVVDAGGPGTDVGDLGGDAVMGGGTPAESLTVKRLAVKLNFMKENMDAVQLQAFAVVSDDFAAAGRELAVDVGGASWTLLLNEKGEGKGGDAHAKVKVRKSRKTGTTTALILFKASKQDLATALAEEGITNADFKKAPVTVVTTLTLDCEKSFYSMATELTYNAKANGSGTAK